MAYEDDPLAKEYDRIWRELARLLPRYHRYLQMESTLSEGQHREMMLVYRRILLLRQRTQRYAEVLRDEGARRYYEEHGRPEPLPTKTARIDVPARFRRWR